MATGDPIPENAKPFELSTQRIESVTVHPAYHIEIKGEATKGIPGWKAEVYGNDRATVEADLKWQTELAVKGAEAGYLLQMAIEAERPVPEVKAPAKSVEVTK